MIRVNVLTESPSPHMMDFWEAINDHKDVKLKVFLENPVSSTKFWGRISEHLDSEVMNWSELSVMNKIRWIMRISSVPADVWILCDNYRLWENHMLAFSARSMNTPTVYLAERTYWERRRFIGARSWEDKVCQALKKPIIPFLIRNFDALACYGSWAIEQYKNMVPSRYLFPTEYYVDLDNLRQIERPKKRANDPVNLGVCGVLTPGKGPQYIVHNLELISLFANWQLAIAGDGPLRDELQSAIPEKLKSRVEFLGHVPYHEMGAFWENIDVLLFPSLFDGWGMVVVEALAAGVPVISGPDVGAAIQYIRNGYNGEICDVDDSFLQAIVPILEAPEKLNKLSINARASVRDYRPEVGAKNFVEHLKILTNQG